MFKLPSVKLVNPLILKLHNNPDEYEERLTKAKYKLPDIFDGIVDRYIDPTDSVLDLGCGTGAVAKVLQAHNHSGNRIANDISGSMIDYVLAEKLYAEGYHGTSLELVEKMKSDNQMIDWAISLSVFYYLPPEEMEKNLQVLYKVSNKGMIISLDGIPPQFADYIEATLGKRLELYDHRGYFESHKIPAGWSAQVVYSGFGWQSSNTGIEIPTDLVVLRKYK
ncbi:MAG: class I SAM-dependent methyltransferase [bacterium]|nr:class I SAM-dependent methyltransferase [bacterium]